ncbi:hypothetical protein AB0F52_15030 [Amycolatopsis sp. NPDC024027]|jgi:hypothetical protein|uniref:hypothetical protein n=1 Tax=unclassified Amycolatopsis TaxID=2618356 RepID=UPI00255B963F|nr:hypothetical protein [Amycolatopsis sp. DG1A-15b]WIX91374.1 hypothetical protein QRY02_13355 [Amycolatopsis sp. DG1A-15b]
MFKKIRDKVNEATQQGAARGAQEFQQHAEQFRRAAAAQGYDITPQLPTPQLAAQAFRNLNADPDMAAFLALPMEEQLRQQQELQAYGTELRRLYDTGEPASLVVRALEPTDRTVAGQARYTATLEVTRADGTTYRTVTPLITPQATIQQYAPGTRHEARLDPADPAKVAVFGPIA